MINRKALSKHWLKASKTVYRFLSLTTLSILGHTWNQFKPSMTTNPSTTHKQVLLLETILKSLFTSQMICQKLLEFLLKLHELIFE